MSQLCHVTEIISLTYLRILTEGDNFKSYITSVAYVMFHHQLIWAAPKGKFHHQRQYGRHEVSVHVPQFSFDGVFGNHKGFPRA